MSTSDQQQPAPWYTRPTWIVVLLVAFFPVGLVLMWRFANWQVKTKQIVTALLIWPMAAWWLWRAGRPKWEIGLAALAGILWLGLVGTSFTPVNDDTSGPPATVQQEADATPNASPTPTSSPPASQSPTVFPATPSPTLASSSPVVTPTRTSPPTSEPTLVTSSPPTVLQQPVIAVVPSGLPAYDRDGWSHWTDADNDCQNARAEVLIAESSVGVTFTTASGGCTVATGLWSGPFTGQTFTAASDVDVDHMVPLKNAHDSGGWAWSAARKRDYANDLSNPQHLMAVDDGTNQSKGSRGPEAWKPPLQSYWCQYAVDWIGIKNTWDLTVTPAEWAALQTMLAACAGGSPTGLAVAPSVVTPTAAPAVGPTAAPTVASTAAPTPALTVTPAPTEAANCDPSYPTICIEPGVPDLNCGDIEERRFEVRQPDPHGFDRDKDGVGCAG